MPAAFSRLSPGKNLSTLLETSFPAIGGGGRPIGITPALDVPYRVEMSPDGVLRWIWAQSPLPSRGKSRAGFPRARKVLSSLWRQFARLSSDEEIRGFAERWGALQGMGTETEPVSEWRNFIALARAILRNAAAPSEGSFGNDSDWAVIGSYVKLDCSRYFKMKVRMAGEARISSAREHERELFNRRILIMQALNKWLADASGTYFIGCIKGKLVVRPTVTTLLGVLGAQLAHRITQADELALCYHCKALFEPERARSSGIRRFCPKCRRHGKPQMYASRDYRRRPRLR